MIITREMEQARARLEAYRDKIQPYPALPEDAPEVKQEVWTPRQWDAVNQLRAQVLFLQSKVNKLLDKKEDGY